MFFISVSALRWYHHHANVEKELAEITDEHSSKHHEKKVKTLKDVQNKKNKRKENKIKKKKKK